MPGRRKQFEEHVRSFPSTFRAALSARLACKQALEAEGSLKIPAHIWLAFLTPPSPDLRKQASQKLKRVLDLKAASAAALLRPKQLLRTRNTQAKANDTATLTILELLYELAERKTLLPRERYEEWLAVANHFGVWRLRYMLEDLIFKTFDPENFTLFSSVVEKQLSTDKQWVSSTRAILEHALTRAGLTGFSIENRRKNIYGVYRKVAIKGKSINDIYDIHGLRILTESESDCYKALDALHHLWPQFPERYKNYIKEPKENGYQSIHTVLSCLEKRPTEFQIRTYKMDEIAESGPANHAEYKKANAL